MAISELTPVQIDRLIDRATRFLSAASQVPAIRARLDQGGYNEKEHQSGWEHLLGLLGYRDKPDFTLPAAQLRQREATVELDQWDGPAFDRARAALDHRFPEQSAYVFDGLSAKTGAEAIGSVRTFLDRVAALRTGSDPARANTREQDAEAVRLLAARRIVDEAEDSRLRALIAEATRIADLPVLAEPDPSQRQQTARTLEAWLQDWRGTARVLITRRDHLIRLGLAERRMSEAAEPAEQPEAELAES